MFTLASHTGDPSVQPMAIRLKECDVVVVGVGAVGGVAVLPLAEAGLDVIGLEAGKWLTRRDFVPDEIRNNVRSWPMAVQKAKKRCGGADVPCESGSADHPRQLSSHDERRGRHGAPAIGRKVGG